MNNDRYQSEEKLQRIYYFGLDEYFDVRLGTLAQHWPEVFDKYVKTHVIPGYYHERIRDEFPGISWEAFQEKYKQRNIETLKLSFKTNVELWVIALLKDAIEEMISEPFRPVPELVINTWPYKDFDNDHCLMFKEILMDRLRDFFDVEFPITFIYKDMKELDVVYVHTQFKALFLYDTPEWMNQQALENNFNKVLPVHTTFFTPSIYREYGIDHPENAKLILGGGDPLKVFRSFARNIIPIEMVDVRLFSVIGKLESLERPDEETLNKIAQKKKKETSPIVRKEQGETFQHTGHQGPDTQE